MINSARSSMIQTLDNVGSQRKEEILIIDSRIKEAVGNMQTKVSVNLLDEMLIMYLEHLGYKVHKGYDADIVSWSMPIFKGGT